MTEIVAAHLERVARELAQQLEDRAIQRAHPPEGEVSVGDEPWECVLCSAESATNEVKHNVTCPILGVAAALAACAREARNEALEEVHKAHQQLAANWRNESCQNIRGWLADRAKEECANDLGKLIRPLERAVGEKAPLDPQGGHHDS